MFMLSNSAVSFACLEFVAKTSNYATKSETILEEFLHASTKNPVQYCEAFYFLQTDTTLLNEQYRDVL